MQIEDLREIQRKGDERSLRCKKISSEFQASLQRIEAQLKRRISRVRTERDQVSPAATTNASEDYIQIHGKKKLVVEVEGISWTVALSPISATVVWDESRGHWVLSSEFKLDGRLPLKDKETYKSYAGKFQVSHRSSELAMLIWIYRENPPISSPTESVFFWWQGKEDENKLASAVEGLLLGAQVSSEVLLNSPEFEKRIEEERERAEKKRARARTENTFALMGCLLGALALLAGIASCFY